MRAIVYTGAGGPEVIAVREVPDPVAGPGQVVVRVRAAGLNRADLIQRRGGYPAPPGWPADIPGLEYAGVVEALGEGVTGLVPGCRVMGLVGGGGQAERVAVPAAEVLPVPERLTDAEAAAVPEAFLTAYDALAVRARVSPGERVLIHAVGSGVSTVAVQLAKWLGATVIGTSRTPAKLIAAGPLGLDEGIDTSARGFAEALDTPVDVVIDFFGGPSLAENLSVLRSKGRLILLGTMQGPKAAEVDVGRILRGRLEVIGSVMRSRPPAERVTLVEAFRGGVLPAIGAGTLSPVIGATFAMDEVARAHEAMESNRIFGKIVLQW